MNSLLRGAVLPALMIGLFFSGGALAQSASKGKASAAAGAKEILLAPEEDSWKIEGDKRISLKSGYPAAIYGSTYRAAPGGPEAQARQYLADNSGMLGLSQADLGSLRLHDIRKDSAGATIRLRQMWKGLAVNKNAEITIHIGREGTVDFVMNGFVYGVSLGDVSPKLSALSARQRVFAHLGAIAENASEESSELMVLRHGGKDRLVYRLNFLMAGMPGDWEAYVDGETGEIVKLEDIATYRKGKKTHAHSEQLLVDGNGNVFDPDPLTSALVTYGGSYVDGADANSAVLTAQLKDRPLRGLTFSGGVHSLVGPFAQVVDFEAPNRGLFSQASSTFAFNRADDAFEAVNVYYHIDSAMRHLNEDLGLNIMPFQYSGGPRFDPHGLNGADNSYYLSGSGQLSFGEGGVDDAEDADVVVHELAHGLHHWATSGGLSQVNGLSEGCGDYFATSYSRSRGSWTSAQPSFFWTFKWDGHNPFWPGRIVNYSATYPAGLIGQIHTDGQIWATANSKILEDIGRNKTDRAFWRGISLTNGSTNQNDAANAVITAARNFGYSFADLTAMRNRYLAAGYNIPAIPNRALFDFDGDGKADTGISRANGAQREWWYQRSSNNAVVATAFGLSGDIITPADFTGDGKTDVAQFRPSTGQWFVLRSEDNNFFGFSFGANGDIPAPADYDGDGKADAAVFRPSTGTWFVFRSSDNQVSFTSFGAAVDKPAVADFDGDGKADISIWKPDVGQWWRINSGNSSLAAYQFGAVGDKPVQGDYTGDGKADVAIFRPSNNTWFVLRSEDLNFFAFPFGAAGDIPAPGDYDGDGKFDAGVFRPSQATWFVNQSSGSTLIRAFGANGDQPIPGAFIP